MKHEGDAGQSMGEFVTEVARGERLWLDQAQGGVSGG